jgi:L-alanine-DL-glutamate epimerase-like enolase superfamily enzyme
MTATMSGARIEKVDVSAYEVPTATDEESDGTLVWSSTTLVVVELRCGEHTGLGYTYCDPSAAKVIESKLVSILETADPLMPQKAWAEMQLQTRQMGHEGIASMAVSAVDIALWDLKARLLGVCLADVLPRFRESVPIYGSGGFTSYTPDELREQVQGWVDDGFRSVKIKVGRDASADPGRVELVRSVAGGDVEVMVDANGANTPSDAVKWADLYHRYYDVSYFEEPVSSDDLHGLRFVHDRAPAGIAIAAGEYGWNLPYFQQMLDAGAVHCLQADVTRCGGISGFLRVSALCDARSLDLSAHCAPQISAQACTAAWHLRHLEYFHDHVRIEHLMFDGCLEPEPGGVLRPDRSRTGCGLAVKQADVEKWRIH